MSPVLRHESVGDVQCLPNLLSDHLQEAKELLSEGTLSRYCQPPTWLPIV